jgi:molybdenum cofactor guanylyltransferase
MGQPKETLPFDNELMLPRVLRLLGEAVDTRAVVAGPRQSLPALPPDVRIVRDRAEGHGPLEGLYRGLSAVSHDADAAYVTGCDVPLLQPDLVRHLLSLLASYDVVVPVDGPRHHPLAAVYRPQLVDLIREMLDQGQRRLICFYDRVATRRVDIQQLRCVDHDLLSLLNLNSPEDYQRALQHIREPDQPSSG